MKKATLGLVLAMMLATLPATLLATSAVAADSATVHIINAQLGSGSTIDVYANGVKVVTQLPISSAVDVTLDAGSTDITACKSNSTGISGAGVCTPTTNIGPNITNFNLVANSNYALAIQGFGAGPGYIGSGAPDLFENNLTQTGLGEFRYTLHNGVPFLGAFDVCIDGVKVVSDVAYGQSAEADVTAQQGAPYAVFSSTGDSSCASPSANINFAAGTNFVQTTFASTPSSGAGVQVLLVGQDTVPNNPDTVAFCANILTGLSGVQPALTALVGNVDPTTVQTITDTQPSVGDMKTFVENTQAILDAGDASVPAAIEDSWVTLTASLRGLLTGFKLVGYNLVGMGQPTVKSIVLGANGVELPGIPPDENVVQATADLTAFIVGNCLASGTPGTEPTAATPVAAAARFTG